MQIPDDQRARGDQRNDCGKVRMVKNVMLHKKTAKRASGDGLSEQMREQREGQEDMARALR
jgi:hypothetical protein